jgi:hypothetical protein
LSASRTRTHHHRSLEGRRRGFPVVQSTNHRARGSRHGPSHGGLWGTGYR